MSYQVKFRELGQAHMIYGMLKSYCRHPPNGHNPTDVKINNSTVTVRKPELVDIVNTLATKFKARHKVNLLA